MPVTVRIPTPLRAVAKGNADVQAKGDTIDELIADHDYLMRREKMDAERRAKYASTT